MITKLDQQILARLLKLDGASLSSENADMVLSLKFTLEDHQQIQELGEKSNEGNLTDEEKDLYAAYARVIDLVGILQSRARMALRKLGKSR